MLFSCYRLNQISKGNELYIILFVSSSLHSSSTNNSYWNSEMINWTTNWLKLYPAVDRSQSAASVRRITPPRDDQHSTEDGKSVLEIESSRNVSVHSHASYSFTLFPIIRQCLFYNNFVFVFFFFRFKLISHTDTRTANRLCSAPGTHYTNACFHAGARSRYSLSIVQRAK